MFGLRDAMLAGDIARTIRMIDGLRAEGEALPLVLWAVGEEIRLLARIAEARALGQDANGLMRRLRIFGAHERLALQALSRVQPRSGRPPCSTRMKSTGSSGPVRARTPVRSLGRNDAAGAARAPPAPTVKAARPPVPSCPDFARPCRLH